MNHPTDGLISALKDRSAAIAVVGLGYVGLPLAVCLAKHFRVIGYDRKQSRITELEAGRDATNEVDTASLKAAELQLSSDPSVLEQARFIIVAVPTPIDQSKQPNLQPLLSASSAVGQHLQAGSVVVFESTVYPGCTEEDCLPVMVTESGLKPHVDFSFGYSPERINPGDQTRRIDSITKVVSGSDAKTLDCIAAIYATAIPAGIHRAPQIKVAEAAKVIENTQRDLNIALVNELALIFQKLDIDTQDVLAAAGTKWNFLPFSPGLVGGHCIGVDPYYLTYRAEAAGYHPQVILAGRRINDGMGAWVAQECIRLLIAADRPVRGAKVIILGITFKGNCPDVRNTRVVDIIKELQRYGAVPLVVDPVANSHEVREEFGIDLYDEAGLPKASALIAAVAHEDFLSLTAEDIADAIGPGGPVIDVKATLDREALNSAGLTLERL